MILRQLNRITSSHIKATHSPGLLQQRSHILFTNQSNKSSKARYHKRKTGKLVHEPTFDEYDKLPGDEFQTVYKGFYDDERHTDPRAFDRFYRLNWGGWIRARGGRGCNHWRRTGRDEWWVKQHILCNETQSKMLEQMFSQKYRKQTWFVDDPYEEYEKRDLEFIPEGGRDYSYSYIKARDYDG